MTTDNTPTPVVKKRRTKPAVVTAFTVEVECPECGDPQPSPDGSHFWTIDELAAASSVSRPCAACPAMISVLFQNRVSVRK